MKKLSTSQSAFNSKKQPIKKETFGKRTVREDAQKVSKICCGRKNKS
ncbi:hypothetical protein [Bacillus sp. FJAT-45037]|nr:hypothetical protein [Bacillus sp. FJAT-45037]